MKKYIVLFLTIALYIIISCFQKIESSNNLQINPIVCEWTLYSYQHNYSPEILLSRHLIHNYSFENITVLNLNDDCNLEELIKPTAQLIHNDKTLPFYDMVIAFELPSTKKELKKNLFQIKDYLTTTGELIATIQTEPNKPYLAITIFKTLYPEICKIISPEEQERIKDLSIMSQQINLLTDDVVKKQISKTGYDIISYVHKNYHIIIKDNKAFKQTVESEFIDLLTHLGISNIHHEILCNKYIELFIAQLKQNEHDNLIYTCDITELHLRKVKINNYEK